MTATHPVLDTPRVPLRLRMSPQPGRDRLDGGWWPQSRDLAVELADLVDHFPPASGRIVRALYSPPDWDAFLDRRVAIRGGTVKAGSFPHDDTHVIQLKTSDRTTLHVLVVPPGLSQDQGEEALLAAATRGNAHEAASLLDTVTDAPDTDPDGHWLTDGGTSGPAAPHASS